MDDFEALLDRLDPGRYAVREIMARLNAFEDLEVAEQDAEEFGLWGYSGLDEAQHPLLDLCGEAHNDFCVVRDLDGSLAFLFETGIGGGEWQVGPLYRQHISESELEPYLADEGAPRSYGLALTRTELVALLDGLPDNPPGPTLGF